MTAGRNQLAFANADFFTVVHLFVMQQRLLANLADFSCLFSPLESFVQFNFRSLRLFGQIRSDNGLLVVRTFTLAGRN